MILNYYSLIQVLELSQKLSQYFFIYMEIQNYLKTFRKRTGITLSDMSEIIGIDTGNLSKIESGQREPNLKVILGYCSILKIPIERFFKNQYTQLIKECYDNVSELKDRILNAMETPNISHRIILLDVVIDRLADLKTTYEK